MGFLINPFLAAAAPSITTPSDLPSIWEWWEPSRNGFSDNDAIGTIAGQVAPGTGHNWGQSSASLKPTYKAGILNGLGIARFDGSNDEMSDVAVTGLTAAHLSIVVKIDNDPPAGGKSGLWLFADAASSYPRTDVTTQIRDASFRGSSFQDFSKSGIDLAQWRVVEVVSTSSQWIYSIDGTVLASIAGSFGNPTVNCILGRAGAFVNNWLDGDVAGLYICSAKLTTDRAAMIGYLNSRFGLSAS